MITTYFAHTAWCAWMAESDEVTGAVPAVRDGVAYVVVSGHSEKVTTRSDKSRSTSTEEYPRLTTYRVSDGERVATRQYAPVFFRFSYVETSLYALAPGGGGVWVMATDPDVSLHTVDPLTLADVLSWPALEARTPALAPDIYIEPGLSSEPVHLSGGELTFRLKSGPWMALETKLGGTRELPSADEPKEDDWYGSRAVDAAVRARKDILEPRIFTAFDLEGKEDTSLAFVASQTSLDREESGVKITRWDTREGAVEGWTVTVPDVKPACCNARAWRIEGLDVLWYEDWLMALDDATGAIRWVRRL